MHVNNSDDPIHLLLSSDGGNTFHEIELKYSNLILNLEGGKDYILKTKETGTKFNFTVTASDVGNEVPVEETVNGKEGCYHDGKFYNVGKFYFKSNFTSDLNIYYMVKISIVYIS